MTLYAKGQRGWGFLTAPFLEHVYLVEFIGAANMMTT
jgi:hypothetical protein